MPERGGEPGGGRGPRGSDDDELPAPRLIDGRLDWSGDTGEKAEFPEGLESAEWARFLSAKQRDELRAEAEERLEQAIADDWIVDSVESRARSMFGGRYYETAYYYAVLASLLRQTQAGEPLPPKQSGSLGLSGWLARGARVEGEPDRSDSREELTSEQMARIESEVHEQLENWQTIGMTAAFARKRAEAHRGHNKETAYYFHFLASLLDHPEQSGGSVPAVIPQPGIPLNWGDDDDPPVRFPRVPRAPVSPQPPSWPPPAPPAGPPIGPPPPGPPRSPQPSFELGNEGRYQLRSKIRAVQMMTHQFSNVHEERDAGMAERTLSATLDEVAALTGATRSADTLVWPVYPDPDDTRLVAELRVAVEALQAVVGKFVFPKKATETAVLQSGEFDEASRGFNRREEERRRLAFAGEVSGSLRGMLADIAGLHDLPIGDYVRLHELLRARLAAAREHAMANGFVMPDGGEPGHVASAYTVEVLGKVEDEDHGSERSTDAAKMAGLIAAYLNLADTRLREIEATHPIGELQASQRTGEAPPLIFTKLAEAVHNHEGREVEPQGRLTVEQVEALVEHAHSTGELAVVRDELMRRGDFAFGADDDVGERRIVPRPDHLEEDQRLLELLARRQDGLLRPVPDEPDDAAEELSTTVEVGARTGHLEAVMDRMDEGFRASVSDRSRQLLPSQAGALVDAAQLTHDAGGMGEIDAIMNEAVDRSHGGITFFQDGDEWGYRGETADEQTLVNLYSERRRQLNFQQLLLWAGEAPDRATGEEEINEVLKQAQHHGYLDPRRRPVGEHADYARKLLIWAEEARQDLEQES